MKFREHYPEIAATENNELRLSKSRGNAIPFHLRFCHPRFLVNDGEIIYQWLEDLPQQWSYVRAATGAHILYRGTKGLHKSTTGAVQLNVKIPVGNFVL